MDCKALCLLIHLYFTEFWPLPGSLSSHVTPLSWLRSPPQFCFFISELQPEHKKPLPSSI